MSSLPYNHSNDIRYKQTNERKIKIKHHPRQPQLTYNNSIALPTSSAVLLEIHLIHAKKIACCKNDCIAAAAITTTTATSTATIAKIINRSWKSSTHSSDLRRLWRCNSVKLILIECGATNIKTKTKSNKIIQLLEQLNVWIGFSKRKFLCFSCSHLQSGYNIIHISCCECIWFAHCTDRPTHRVKERERIASSVWCACRKLWQLSDDIAAAAVIANVLYMYITIWKNNKHTEN